MAKHLTVSVIKCMVLSMIYFSCRSGVTCRKWSVIVSLSFCSALIKFHFFFFFFFCQTNTWRNLHITEATQKSTPIPVAITLYCERYRSNSAVYHPLLLYCCFSPPLGLSSLLFQLFCHCVEVGVICHFQLSEVLKKPGLLQERDWKCLGY